MKTISTYISLMIILLITTALGFMIYTWLHGLAIQSSQEVERETISTLQCQKASIRIENILACNQNYLNFSIRNVGRIDLKDFIVSIKFNDNKIVNYENVFECFTDKKLELLSGELKCGYIFDNSINLLNSIEIFITSKQCPNVYDSLAIKC